MPKKTEAEKQKNREAQQSQLKAIISEMTIIVRRQKDEQLSNQAVSELIDKSIGDVFEVVRRYPAKHSKFPNRMRVSYEFEDGHVLAISKPRMKITSGEVRDYAEDQLDELMEMRGLV
jgi:hypothetical protein